METARAILIAIAVLYTLVTIKAFRRSKKNIDGGDAKGNDK